MKDYVDESIEVSIDCNFGESYDKEWALKDEGWRDGKLEGKRENQIEIAKAMLVDKVSTDMISKYTGLYVEEIEELQKL